MAQTISRSEAQLYAGAANGNIFSINGVHYHTPNPE